MREDIEKLQFFEIYYKMGKDRTYEKLAKKINKSLASVKKWGAEFGWQDRVLERDKQAMRNIIKETDREIYEDRLAYRKIIKATVHKYTDKLKNGNIDPSINDLVKLLRIDNELMTGLDQGTLQDLLHEGEDNGTGDINLNITLTSES